MLKTLYKLAMLGTFGALVFGFFGFLHPAFDTAANLRAHLAILLFVLAGIWLILTRAKYSVLIMAFAVFSLYTCTTINVGTYFTEQNSPVETSKTYRLLSLNLFYKNPTPQKAIDLINSANADILALSEISSAWKSRLKFLDDQYAYKYYCPEWRTIGGTLIFSRFPFSGDKEYCHTYAALALVSAEIEGVKVDIGAVHTRWPWPASGPRQLRAMKPALNALDPDALIAGDFNATTWTYMVRSFAQNGKLKIVGGIGATWIYEYLPTTLAKFFGLPIDNAMVKGRVIIKEARTLDPVGSDHLPVLIDFAIAK